MILLKFFYSNLRKLAELFGIHLSLSRIRKNEEYEPIAPGATYAPWLSDKNFQKTFEMVKNYTMVDKYRCFELWQLVAESAKLQGALVEIGVWRGGTGALIAKSAELNGIKDTLYLCDTFEGVVKAGLKDSRYEGGEHANTSIKIVEELIFQKLKMSNIKILQGIFPDETAKFVNEDKFRFCHIDVDVYQSAKDIVDWIWPKITVGGIIVFDDYGFRTCDGITKLVNEERGGEDRIVIHNLNGHAVVIKTK